VEKDVERIKTHVQNIKQIATDFSSSDSDANPEDEAIALERLQRQVCSFADC
jgi:hypothetical protein